MLRAIVHVAGFKIIDCYTERTQSIVQQYVSTEVVRLGTPLSKQEVKELSRKLNELHLGDSLCVIARKELGTDIGARRALIIFVISRFGVCKGAWSSQLVMIECNWHMIHGQNLGPGCMVGSWNV